MRKVSHCDYDETHPCSFVTQTLITTLPYIENNVNKRYTIAVIWEFSISRLKYLQFIITFFVPLGGRRGRDRMVVGFTTTYAISAYHHWCCEFESRSGRGVQHYNTICQWLATGRWFSPGPPFSSTNKTDRHDITEILLKVALNTIKQAKKTVPLGMNGY